MQDEHELEHIEVYMCGYCSFQARRLLKYLTHLKHIHQVEYGFSVTCAVDGCEKKYSNVDSLIKHMKRKHTDLNIGQHDNEAEDINALVHERERNGDNDVERGENDIDGDDQEEGDHDVQQRVPYDYKRHLALFILALREEKKLPMNACSQIINQLDDLFQVPHMEVRQASIDVLNRNGIDHNTIDGFDEIFSPFASISGACSALNSESKQNRYFADNFDYVEAQEVELGHEAGKCESYMYIPIKKTLQALMKHEDVFSEVVNGHASADARLRDFCDGQAYKQHPIFSSDETVLQINLYYDDFQVVNPLGTKIKKYKMAAFYFVLGNLSPQYRSKLEVIQLLILCRSELLKKYGMAAVLDRLINDLKSLETEGVSITNQERQYNFRGVVAFVCADNLAAHSLGGFVESFTSNRCCRLCMATREERRQQFRDQECRLRTQDSHAAQVASVLQYPDLASVYGVKSDSPLSKLDYYDPIWGSPSDLAHDLFEGFVCDVLRTLILYFVQQRYFTLRQLNQKMKAFKYAECDRANKPSLFAEDVQKFKIKQTASQCWCLLRLLPLLLYEYVPQDDECLIFLVDLLDIVDLVCSPSFLPGEAYLLSDMISHFLERYYAEFDENVPSPKAHYLTHYGRQILHFGPLIHCWTLRFEGKHNYFKEIASRTKNRKNLCMTLANRHQYQQCLYHSSANFLSGHDVDHQTVKGGLVPVRLLNNAMQELLQPILGGSESVYQAESVTVNGVNYTPGCCVIHGFEEDSYAFGCLKHVFVIGGFVYLLLEILNTEEFCRGIHGYVVSKTERMKLCRVVDLLDYHPLGMYELPDTDEFYIVVLKYTVAV